MKARPGTEIKAGSLWQLRSGALAGSKVDAGSQDLKQEPGKSQEDKVRALSETRWTSEALSKQHAPGSIG